MQPMSVYYEERLAKAKAAVAHCQIALDSGLNSAPEHTAAGIPTSPASSVHPLQVALDEADAHLESVRAEGKDPT
jgi:hypothetical protein